MDKIPDGTQVLFKKADRTYKGFVICSDILMDKRVYVIDKGKKSKEILDGKAVFIGTGKTTPRFAENIIRADATARQVETFKEG